MPIKREDSNKDFNLCSEVCERITKDFGKHTPAVDFPEIERVVVLVWTVSGIVENGGFRYLFGSVLPGDPDFLFTIAAFKKIGCSKAAQAVNAAVCLFPSCKPQSDNAIRVSWYEKQSQEVRDRLDTEFWRELEHITACLAKYIRTNNLDESVK